MICRNSFKINDLGGGGGGGGGAKIMPTASRGRARSTRTPIDGAACAVCKSLIFIVLPRISALPITRLPPVGSDGSPPISTKIISWRGPCQGFCKNFCRPYKFSISASVSFVILAIFGMGIFSTYFNSFAVSNSCRLVSSSRCTASASILSLSPNASSMVS